jgi:hypothetical protein
MNLQLNHTVPEIVFWDGQKLTSQRDLPIALDVETTLIEDERIVPQLALAVASDGHHHVVIHPDRLGEFLQQHRREYFVGHNIQFDFWVVDQFLAANADTAQRILWTACHEGRLLDTMVLDMLIQLGSGAYRVAAGQGGSQEGRVYPANLAVVATDYLSTVPDKDDPYRCRFGELVGLAVDQMRQADPAFFRYALMDAVVTHRLYPALTQKAHELMAGYGFKPNARLYEIHPDAIGRYGYLSELIQVKASIVLSYMYRQGVTVDHANVGQLVDTLRQRVDELTLELQRDYPEALEFGRDGNVKLTPQSQTPSFGERRLLEMLARVTDEIGQQGEPIDAPRSDGKKGGISRSMKRWLPYRERHRFLDIWIEMKAIEKQLGFLSRLDAPVLHCRYGLLTRTGRTSCSKPRDASIPGINLQQMPKDRAFRDLFVPRTPNDRLLIADYAAIELRTLGAVCRSRFGRSRLAEVISQGVDPHAFTAAAIQGMPFEEFLALKHADPGTFRQKRQAAKAINFGVPGGLGARSLREYAETNYGVVLTEKEAGEFRSKLITEVYPELNDQDGYLAALSMNALSRNLGVPETILWDTFDRSGKRNFIAARGVEKVVAGSSQASNYYQQRVWSGLEQLCRAGTNANPKAVQAISARLGSESLYQTLYHQKAASLTGRIRDGVGFTDSKNTPFQSLAADGSKLALWNLLFAGYDVYGFVHDEILVNLPANHAEVAAPQVVAIMKSSMEEVLFGIPADCAWVVSDRWAKPD